MRVIAWIRGVVLSVAMKMPQIVHKIFARDLWMRNSFLLDYPSSVA